MNKGRIQAMIEEQNEQERHQFLAGDYGFILKVGKNLTARRRALGEKMIEAEVSELELEQERNTK